MKAETALTLVLVSAVVTGLVLYALLPDLNLAAAIALGAVVSPPDAVAATSIGKRLYEVHFGKVRLATDVEIQDALREGQELIVQVVRRGRPRRRRETDWAW